MTLSLLLRFFYIVASLRVFVRSIYQTFCNPANHPTLWPQLVVLTILGSTGAWVVVVVCGGRGGGRGAGGAGRGGGGGKHATQQSMSNKDKKKGVILGVAVLQNRLTGSH